MVFHFWFSISGHPSPSVIVAELSLKVLFNQPSRLKSQLFQDFICPAGARAALMKSTICHVSYDFFFNHGNPRLLLCIASPLAVLFSHSIAQRLYPAPPEP
jgi:hypothetical protein